MAKKIVLKYKTPPQNIEITPPASKSISNRVLIIDALAKKKAKPIENISTARDTKIMLDLLENFDENQTLNVLDAGTTMRFLTAMASVCKNEKLLKGTKRMEERPILPLSNALLEIGADIEYIKNVGFPPLKVKPIENQKRNNIDVEGNISSQFISALLMIAPKLPKGLNITIKGERISSLPYIKMTLEIMKKYGVSHIWEGNCISIKHQDYGYDSDKPFHIESDWSAVSYWYALVAISKDISITLNGYEKKSIQGDSAIMEIMRCLGVNTEFNDVNDSITISYNGIIDENFSYDFTDTPDLAQTIIVICSVLGINATFTGLESLFIKETNRVKALENELLKFGVELFEAKKGVYQIKGTFTTNKSKEIISIETYDDHRMAMSFAPLAVLMPLEVLNPDVVNKSYPQFWEDLDKTDVSCV